VTHTALEEQLAREVLNGRNLKKELDALGKQGRDKLMCVTYNLVCWFVG
jgi:hypothetical protein